ncbi:MAG: hypothetical protein JSV65_14715 [Armatimonadota bacterium]|nr:MAG: hypothetical protein JSV65_14715 [Armatimonadota bacterium]
MSPGSPTGLLRNVLGLALCAVAVASCGKKLPPIPQRPTARASLTLRAQPEGVFTFTAPKLADVRGDRQTADHYVRIAHKLTPGGVGTEQVKEISLKGQQITVRTHVKDAADCEQQAKRIRQLLSDVYEDAVLVSADTRQMTSSDLDELIRVLEARAEAAMLTDFSAEPRPPDIVVVGCACAGDPEWAKELLTHKGLLQFRVIPSRYAYDITPVGGTTFRDESGTAVAATDVVAQSPVILSGGDFAPMSRVEAGPNGSYHVTFTLREETGEAFEAFTRDHVNRSLAIVLDGSLISCPRITRAIRGVGVIDADFDRPGGRDRAERLAIFINSGPLPLDVECVESSIEQLSP